MWMCGSTRPGARIPPRASNRRTADPFGGLHEPAGITAAIRPLLTQTSSPPRVRSVYVESTLAPVMTRSGSSRPIATAASARVTLWSGGTENRVRDMVEEASGGCGRPIPRRARRGEARRLRPRGPSPRGTGLRGRKEEDLGRENPLVARDEPVREPRGAAEIGELAREQYFAVPRGVHPALDEAGGERRVGVVAAGFVRRAPRGHHDRVLADACRMEALGLDPLLDVPLAGYRVRVARGEAERHVDGLLVRRGVEGGHARERRRAVCRAHAIRRLEDGLGEQRVVETLGGHHLVEPRGRARRGGRRRVKAPG